MRPLYRKIFLLLVITVPTCLHAQDSANWETHSEKVEGLTSLNVSLYRGWVELLPSDSNVLKVSYSVFDYDHYDHTNALIPFTSSSEATVPKMRVHESEFLIENSLSREIIALKVYVPKGMNVSVKITHLGIVNGEALTGEVEIESFSGQVKLSQLSNSVSVHIVRNGTIHASFDDISETIYSAFTTFDGDIDVTIPSSANMALNVTTDLGEIQNDHDLKWVLSNPRKFTVRLKDGSVEEKISHTKTAKLGKGSSKFLIRNVHGKISIKSP